MSTNNQKQFSESELAAMPLDQLRSIALEIALAEEEAAKPGSTEAARQQAIAESENRAEFGRRGTGLNTIPQDGRMVSQEEKDQPKDQQDHFDNSAENQDEEEESATDDKSEDFIVRREIDLGTGSGIQVFVGTGKTQAEAYSNFADKLTEAQRNATLKIKSMAAELKAHEQKKTEAQQAADHEYVIARKLEKQPAQTIKELVAESLADISARQQRGLTAQEQWVAQHPEYVCEQTNGQKLLAEAQRLYPNISELTVEVIEAAYQSLRGTPGSLKLRDGNSNEETPAAQPAAPARPAKRSSSVSSSRSSAFSHTKELSEDDLYNKLSLSELKELANKKLKESNDDTQYGWRS